MAAIHDKYLLLLSMVGIGIAWASTLSMPYAILAGSLPPRKTGTYMGIFNFFIVIPEIVASLAFGWVMGHLLNNNRLTAVVAGGLFLLLSALLVYRVQDVTDVPEPQPAAAAVALSLRKAMDHFPEFMKHPANRIAKTSQATPGVEGYVFDGADGSQMAFWTCPRARAWAASSARSSEFISSVIVIGASSGLDRCPLPGGASVPV